MVAVLAIRIQLFDIGYRQGSKFVSSLSGMKEKITESASVLGLTVVGGMVATMVQFPLRTVSVTVATDPVTGEERVLYPGDILRNGEIVDYARKLLTCASPQIKEAGFQLLDLLLPLSPGRKTEEERRDEGAFEQMLLRALSEGDEYETEEEPLS